MSVTDLSGATRKSADSLATAAGGVEEDDKERTIAKAALSIAELSEWSATSLYTGLIYLEASGPSPAF